MKQDLKTSKLKFNKQTIQKLNGDKMANVKAGAAAHTTTVLVSIVVGEVTTIFCWIGCTATI
jgi:hypothetical protein